MLRLMRLRMMRAVPWTAQTRFAKEFTQQRQLVPLQCVLQRPGAARHPRARLR